MIVLVLFRDAKIAALVQNSVDTDKLLSDARLEKLAYLKELHNANERCAHLEAKYEWVYMSNLCRCIWEFDLTVRTAIQ